MTGCLAYLANSYTFVVLPEQADQVARIVEPIQLVEMVFMLWMLVRSARMTGSHGGMLGRSGVN